MSSTAIWPGSSSFAAVSESFYKTPSTGSRPTSFGYYDGDVVFKAEADKVADYCARNMGYPITDIELQDLNLWTAFEEAVTKFSTMVNMYNAKDYILTLQGTSDSVELSGKPITTNLGRTIEMAKTYGSEAGSGGDVDWKRGYINISSSIQQYDLNTLWADVSESGERIEVKRVFHNQDPAITRYFDPQTGTGAGSQNMLDGFGWGSYSPAVSFLVMPIYADLLRMQAIEINDQVRKSAYSFEIQNNKLNVFPIPRHDYTMYFDYVVTADRNNPTKSPAGTVSDLSNVPYNRIQFGSIKDVGVQWIYEYALGSAKEMLGLVRSKYSVVPIPGSETTLNGTDLMSQGRETKANLLLELKELLLSMGRETSMQAEATIAVAMQQQLSKVPNYIYIK
tara:strand:- start:5376 stop:6557 length:1182 start_codon:yes stop_codon:yes gene_type:complete